MSANGSDRWLTGRSMAGVRRRLAAALQGPESRPPPPVVASPVDVYADIAALADRHGSTLASGRDLTRYERRVFSQNGEDGVLAEILDRIGPKTRYFVEFGIGGGHQGTCVLLADVFAWAGLFIECDADGYASLARKYSANPAVTTLQSMVTPGNVEGLFASAAVPDEPDVLSIDVDGNDWWIWQAITRYQPRVVVVEYNGNLDAEQELVKPLDEHAAWDGTCWFGASLGAYERLAADKGYRLVHTDLRGVNAFFVRSDLAQPFEGIEAPRRSANYDLWGARLPGDPAQSEWVDLAVETTS